MDNAVIEFLAGYRSTPHTVTNISPSEMLNHRRLRTTLDLLQPCQSDSSILRACQRANHVTHTKTQQFQVGDSVWVQTFCPGPRWVPVTINSKMASVMYYADIEGKGVMWRHHVYQLRTRITSLPMKMNSANSEYLKELPTPTTSENVSLPLHQSIRIRKQKQMWMPT